MSITAGLEATVERIVADADTAAALRSGDVDVLGTPAVVALCEEAAVAAVTESLDAAQTTVGTNIAIDHLAPTLVGKRIVAHARLTRIDGRTLHFDVHADDTSGPIARGTHTRVVVDRERFLGTAAERF